jgi:NAD(P)-dependent dehydrogenase (short-subunit alcohol dehydrogenase family)
MDLMDGKICLVTGATSGIGYYTAREIARLGAKLVIIGRYEAKCIRAVQTIQADTGNPAVDYLLADLSSQTQIREAARRFYEHYDLLDVLVNNAGGFFLRRQISVDGLEMTFALNHLAYFLLTDLLLRALKASPSARVVNVSSGSHYNQQLDFGNLQFTKFYNPLHAYGCSKLANVLFTYELVRRLSGTRVTSNALSPGMVATDIWKKVNPWLTPLIFPVVQRLAKPALEGAQTSIYLATSPDLEGVTGKYYTGQHPVRSSAASYDLDAARRLWEVSLQLVGLSESAAE